MQIRKYSTHGIDESDLPYLQGFVHGAYVIMAAKQVGYPYDYEHLRKAVNSENIKVPGASVLNDYFQKVFEDEKFHPDKFQIFFKFDTYLLKAFGSCFGSHYEDGSMSFEYDNLCSLSTEELVHLKFLIDRVQLLMSSNFYTTDFRLAFERLEKCQPNNFIEGFSEFDYSKINSVRVRYILAIYKSTTIWKLFEVYDDFLNFRKKIYVWLFHKGEMISKILKPSHKSIDDSRFFAFLYLPSSHVVQHNLVIVGYFLLYFAINQLGFNKNLVGYREHIHDLLMDDCKKWYVDFFNDYQNFTSHLRVRKIFLDFLLTYSFKADKRGRTICTKELRFLSLWNAVQH